MPGAHLVANASELLLDQPLHEVDDSLPLGVGLRSRRNVSQQLIDVLLHRLCCWALPCGSRVCSLEAGSGRRCFGVETGHVYYRCRCLIDLHHLGHGVTAWPSAASCTRQTYRRVQLPIHRLCDGLASAVACKNRMRPTVLKQPTSLLRSGPNLVSENIIVLASPTSLPHHATGCRASGARIEPRRCDAETLANSSWIAQRHAGRCLTTCRAVGAEHMAHS